MGLIQNTTVVIEYNLHWDEITIANEEVCSICHETIPYLSTVASLICEHCLHIDCAQRLKDTGYNRCPLCRHTCT